MSGDDSRPDGWRTHEAEQLRAWMRLSFLERLRWLDQAKRFAALAVEAARKRRESCAAAAQTRDDFESPPPGDAHR
jgi:hypothetical protein